MEDYTAADDRPLDLCIRDVRESDVYVGLFAWRYGYVPPAEHGNGDGKSITELEYRQAERSGLRKLLFFAHPDTCATWPDRFRDDVTGQGDHGERLARFREEVGTEKTASFFRTPEQLATLVLASLLRSGTTGRIYNVPRLPTGFVPRPAVSSAIVEALTRGNTLTRGVNTLIQGAGGFGKTTLALEACHDASVVEAFPDGILWTSLGSTPNLTSILSDLHALATGSPPTVTNDEQVRLALGTALRGRRCLLVVDDVWTAAQLKVFLNLDGPRLLVTTRVRTLLDQTGQPDWAEVAVGEMAADEASALLGRGMPLDASEVAGFQQLATRLGGWPLLLELVGARIAEEQKRRGRSPAEAAAVINTLLERRGVFAFDRQGETDRNAALSRSIDLSVEAADALSAGLGRRSLELAVFPQSVEIPTSVLGELWDLDDIAVEEETLRPLDGLNLLQWTPARNVFRLHALVGDALGARLGVQSVIAIHRQLLNRWGNPHALRSDYAWRWFGWHCVGAGDLDRLKAVLRDLRWLEAKLAATSVNELLGDFARCPAEADPTLSGAIRIAGHALAADPEQLRAQLFARIPERDTSMRSWLVEQAGADHRGWLQPVRPTLAGPGGPLIRTLELHADPVTSVAITPDGRLAASGGEDHRVHVWEIATGRVVRSLIVHRSVTSLAVSPDGVRLMAGLRDGRIAEWRLVDGVLVRTWDAEQFTGEVTRLAFTPDGSCLISTRGDLAILWDVDRGERIGTFRADVTIADIAISSDGRLLLAAHGSRVQVWDLERRAAITAISAGYPEPDPVLALISRQHDVGAVRLVGNGDHAVFGTSNRVVVAELNPLRVLHDLEGHTADVTTVAVLAAGHRAVSGSRDGTIRLWDLDAGTALLAAEAHAGVVIALAATPDDRFVVSAGSDNAVKVWDLTAPAENGAVRGHTADVSGVVMIGDGRRVATSSRDHTIRVWDLERAEALTTIDTRAKRSEGDSALTHESLEQITAMTVAPDRRRIVLLAWNVEVWDLDEETLAASFYGPHRRFGPLIVTKDGSGIVFAKESTLEVRSAADGTLLVTLEGHTDSITTLVATPDRERIVSVSADGTLRVWDLARRETLRMFDGHEGEIEAAAITADGRQVVSGGQDAMVHVWNVDDDGSVVLKGHDYRITHVRVTSDGTYAVTASWDDTVRVWALRRGAQAGLLTGHRGRVTMLEISPDDRCIAVGTEDGVLAVWDIVSRKRIGSLDVDAPITCAAVSEDSRTLVAGDTTGGVHFLRIVHATDV